MLMIQLYHRRVAALLEKSRWLVLIHQLPKDPAYLRVKIGRRLARVGALALKNSVYVLPLRDATAEDLQWVRREIVEGGGEATVLEAELVEGLSDEEVETRFRDAKDLEYAELLREAKELPIAAGGRRKRRFSAAECASALEGIARLERRVLELAATDFFGASGRDRIREFLAGLRAKAQPELTSVAPASVAQPLHGRTWVTRTGIHVDRIASAWLIQRFIDPEAVFKFVPASGYVPELGELRFDMFEAEFSHVGDLCTFEVLCERLGPRDPGLRALGELVHDIDLKDGKFGRSETPGLAAQLAGLALLHRDDETRLARGSQLFDELYAYMSARVPT
jgi:hypothetical protein